jgi:hypothetical protein
MEGNKIDFLRKAFSFLNSKDSYQSLSDNPTDLNYSLSNFENRKKNVSRGDFNFKSYKPPKDENISKV